MFFLKYICFYNAAMIHALMKRVLLLLIILCICDGCRQSDTQINSILDFTPEDAEFVLAIYDLETVKSDIRNNALLNAISSSSDYGRIRDQIQKLSTSDSILLWVERKGDSLDFSYVTRLKDSLFREGVPDSLELPQKVIDSFFIGSSSRRSLASVVPNDGQRLKDLLKASEGNKPFSLILNGQAADGLGKPFLNDYELGFSGPTLIETTINSEEIQLTGVTYLTDSLPQLLGAFKNTQAQESRLQEIAPANSDGYLSLTYNDFQAISLSLEAFRTQPLDSTFNPELFQTISEIGVIHYDEGSLVAIRSIDGQATREALRDHTENQSTFRNIDLKTFNDPGLFAQVFYPFIQVNDLNLYVELGDFFVFGPTTESMENAIAAFQNGTTLGASQAFKACAERLGDASSLLLVVKNSRFRKILSDWFPAAKNLVSLSDYSLSAFQFVQDMGFTHFNGIVKKHKEKTVSTGVSEMFSVTLDADIITPPQFVVNHRTKERDIVVQDVNNTLYLISNTGKILWKKKLIGNILGRIEQVDLFRNGRLQLAFATPFRVYVIDRNGNFVSRFPMKFGDRITQPLSVFDYDNNRRYRFLVTQNRELLMYDRNARFVNGFKYRSSLPIITQPKHFRIGNKDYIVFGAGKQFRILNRRGATRISVSGEFEFSGNPFFLYRNTFLTTSSDGQLLQVDENGQVKSSNLKLTKDHKIFATAKTLVTLDENELGIKQNTIELDYGEYTDPRIHYINDKIYVTLTDMQSQKVYLFDSQAQPIENFPVYGNSTMDLDNADGDRNLEFVVKGESNTIVMYKKN